MFEALEADPYAYESQQEESEYSIDQSIALNVSSFHQPQPIQEQLDGPHIIRMQQYLGALQDQLKRVCSVFLLMSFLCLVQMTITIYEANLRWAIQLPIQRCLSLAVVMQYFIHAYYFSKQGNYAFELRQETFYTYACPLELETYIAIELTLTNRIGFWRLMDFFFQKKFKLTTINKFLYFWMYTVGMLAWFQSNNNFDTWYLIELLLPGCIIATVLGFFGTLFILALPFIIYQHFMVVRSIQRRRQRSTPQSKKFSQLGVQTDQPCYICLVEFQRDDQVTQLNCHTHHIFHEDCLKPWLETQNFCPICRMEIS